AAGSLGASRARGGKVPTYMPEGGWGGSAAARAASAGKKEAAHNTFAAGDTVDHKTFGRGKVLKVDGDSLVIKFARTGQTKTLLKDYAPIVKIN
ncbi:MAG: DNA helicase UvrD, partial [Slackia isoflavoniconvertens]|nr:DNA helicase UvrD [Slackia isoflavoniconvertens]